MVKSQDTGFLSMFNTNPSYLSKYSINNPIKAKQIFAKQLYSELFIQLYSLWATDWRPRFKSPHIIFTVKYFSLCSFFAHKLEWTSKYKTLPCLWGPSPPGFEHTWSSYGWLGRAWAKGQKTTWSLVDNWGINMGQHLKIDYKVREKPKVDQRLKNKRDMMWRLNPLRHICSGHQKGITETELVCLLACIRSPGPDWSLDTVHKLREAEPEPTHSAWANEERH